MNVKIWSVGMLIIGALFIISGILLLTVVPLTVRKHAAKGYFLGLDDNGTYNEITRRWMEPKYSMHLKVWVVSVTNPKEVVQHGSHPNLIEKGPYVFREHQKKEINFMENNTRVLYRNKHYYFYDQNASCVNCSLNDTVTIPNVIFEAIVDVAAKSDLLVRKLLELVLQKLETPFITTTVDEMLFKGYQDPLIDLICSSKWMKMLCIVANLPARISFLENGTDDGEYLIDSGLGNARRIGRIYAWNGQSELSWWGTAQARMINGTDGELFPPALSAFDDLPIFTGQLGRSIYIRYDESVTYGGIPSYRYVIPAAVYDPFLPENKGFCHSDTPRYFDSDIQPDGCLPAGMFDIGRTKSGSPHIYLSGAHFYNSPPQVYQNITGFPKPSSSDQGHLDLEPFTGVIVDAFEASQINVGMISGNLRMFNKMANMIVPVLWLNEIVVLDDATKNDLLGVVSPLRMVYIFGMLLIGLGLLLWIAFLTISVVQIYMRRHSSDEDHLVEGDSEDQSE